MSHHSDQRLEQRLDARQILRTEVALQLASGEVHHARSYDLSLGGMALVTQVQLAQGTLSQLEFVLAVAQEDAQPVRIAAQLVYCLPCHGGYKSGWQFIDPTSAQLASVRGWLAKI